MKQRRAPYLINSDRNISSNRGGYVSSNFDNQSISQTQSSYDIIPEQEQKLRLFIIFKSL